MGKLCLEISSTENETRNEEVYNLLNIQIWYSCEFHKKVFFYPYFIGDLYWGSPIQMKKPSEKLINLPMDTSLVSAGVGIWPDLFQSKSHAIHTGWKSLVIISIVTEAKCWFVHI